MPLPYEVEKPLDIPEDWFNEHGLASVTVQGSRYGGHWVIHLLERVGAIPHGEIRTCHDLDHDDLTKQPRYPGLAVDSAYVWIHDEATRRGWRLVGWDDHSSRLPPDQAPFFIFAMAVVANEHFVPKEGVVYVDEIPR